MTCHCIGPPGACPCIQRGYYHFTPYAPAPPPWRHAEFGWPVPAAPLTAEDVRQIVREELEKWKADNATGERT